MFVSQRALSLVVAFCTVAGLGCGKATPANDSPTAEVPGGVPAEALREAPRESDVLELVGGQWVYAEDPRGEVAFEALYAESTILIDAQSYVFALADLPRPLTGRWSILRWDAHGGMLHVDFGEGRETEQHFEVRRGEGGEVEGFVLSEGEQRVGPRYYVRQEG